MRDALIFAVVVVGAVVALFPDAKAPAAPVAQPERATRIDQRAAAIVPSGGATQLTREGDGHFYAPVTANGRQLRMLVDTGASVVALTGADARLIGLSWTPGQLRVVAEGASGPVRGVPLVLDRLTLGNHEGRNVAAVIVPEGLPISLLGQSFLKDVEPVRIERDRMVLGDQK